MMLSSSSTGETRPDTLFPVTHSILAPDALLTIVTTLYAIGRPVACSLIRTSWNDHYLIHTVNDRYVLRVYGAGWHTLPEIQYELDLLRHLAQQGASVAEPIARTNGQLLVALQAPEGRRFAALFTYAPGKVPLPGPIATLEQSRHFGRALAEIHTAADTFTSEHIRPSHDLMFLLDKPLAVIQPFLTHRPDDWSYLVRVAHEVRIQMTGLVAQGLSWGIIHGDPFSANAVITGDNHVTWYDFDFCGPGWRAADLVSVYALVADRQDDRFWQAFLAGYGEQRRLTATDLAAVPVLLAANDIWAMGVNLAKGPIHGFEWLGDEYFDTRLEWIRRSEAMYTGGKGHTS